VVRIGRSAHEITTGGCLQAKRFTQSANQHNRSSSACAENPHPAHSAWTNFGEGSWTDAMDGSGSSGASGPWKLGTRKPHPAHSAWTNFGDGSWTRAMDGPGSGGASGQWKLGTGKPHPAHSAWTNFGEGSWTRAMDGPGSGGASGQWKLGTGKPHPAHSAWTNFVEGSWTGAMDGPGSGGASGQWKLGTGKPHPAHSAWTRSSGGGCIRQRCSNLACRRWHGGHPTGGSDRALRARDNHRRMPPSKTLHSIYQPAQPVVKCMCRKSAFCAFCMYSFGQKSRNRMVPKERVQKNLILLILCVHAKVKRWEFGRDAAAGMHRPLA
jgi:hypothetical protein